MSTNISIERDKGGNLHMVVNGEPAYGAKVTNFQQIGEEMCAVVTVPTKHLTLGEVSKVVPFVKPAA